MGSAWISGLLLLVVTTHNGVDSFTNSLMTDICKNFCEQFQTEVDECKRGCRFYDRIIESSEKASHEANARHHCNSSCRLAYAGEARRTTCIRGCHIAKKQYDNANIQDYYALGLLSLLHTFNEVKSAVMLPRKADGTQTGHFVQKEPPARIVVENRSQLGPKRSRPSGVSTTKLGDNVVVSIKSEEKETSSFNVYLISLLLISFGLTSATCYLLVTKRRRWLRRIVTNSTNGSEPTDDEESPPPSYDVAIKLGLPPNYSSVMLADTAVQLEELDVDDASNPPEQ